MRVFSVRFHQHLNNDKDHAFEIFNTDLLREDGGETETEWIPVTQFSKI